MPTFYKQIETTMTKQTDTRSSKSSYSKRSFFVVKVYNQDA
ncbi:hypothetical protein HMPREF0658_0280 [Hoylesella marshii DSM 16973 = JCM 13450]|uniref:Uncharacterized protein n=1 Tax=Hoylesella marshii DSM 16973 = JCM 13450 TaxID=862515 RepID=E0NQ29_9BACT|nr:hypothetical protein HMPREF0658_0280 [Hoylesella marshii DSM 16973 = JCM 13450]